ncbi:hypothetical protein [Rhizocola hellebori]|uniref:hypothetical protein n=1 Tax=Rhizocola hellebori TaxID=1392758 RepID=UPI0019410EB9|nr:hypothetical protein [Rhizocola hellebori]
MVVDVVGTPRLPGWLPVLGHASGLCGIRWAFIEAIRSAGDVVSGWPRQQKVYVVNSAARRSSCWR